LRAFSTLFFTYFSLALSLFRCNGVTWICTHHLHLCLCGKEKTPVNPEVTVDQSGAWICQTQDLLNLPDCNTNPPLCLFPSSDPQVQPFHWYTIRVCFDSETKLGGNVATRATLRPSTSLGLSSQYPTFPFRISPHTHTQRVCNFYSPPILTLFQTDSLE